MTLTVKEKFSNSVHVYEQHARIQEEVAGRLVRSLAPWCMTLPEGPVLELGAGTGFLSRKLPRLLPDRTITITDISPEMLLYCREKMESTNSNLTFRVLDAERFKPSSDTYALVTGNFVAQWFRDPAWTLGRFAEALKPGGLLLTSFPGSDSFPEWRQKCMELGLPYTGNPLPDTEEMVIKLSTGPVQVDYYEDAHTAEFPDSLSFFRYLKNIGADSTTHDRKLTRDQLKLLMRHWDESSTGPVRVTWHLVFLALKKDL
ncbi:MAG: methyltransferase domain-containing protein [Balneolaceae bacterium]